MSSVVYKKKIAESLNTMDAAELKQAWLILREIGPGKKIPVVADKKELEKKLSKGIRQLNNSQGSDFGLFIGGLKRKYGKG